MPAILSWNLAFCTADDPSDCGENNPGGCAASSEESYNGQHLSRAGLRNTVGLGERCHEHIREVLSGGCAATPSRWSGNCRLELLETIRAARRVGWLSDPGAEAALRLTQDRNLTVHMYHKEIGAQIGSRLTAHAALLRRWLEALQRSAAAI
jgi:hypothetical protein